MLNLSKKVTIIEVGPRDGLQNEKLFVPTDIKKQFISELRNAGLQENGAYFVCVPKMGPTNGGCC